MTAPIKPIIEVSLNDFLGGGFDVFYPNPEWAWKDKAKGVIEVDDETVKTIDFKRKVALCKSRNKPNGSYRRVKVNFNEKLVTISNVGVFGEKVYAAYEQYVNRLVVE